MTSEQVDWLRTILWNIIYGVGDEDTLVAKYNARLDAYTESESG